MTVPAWAGRCSALGRRIHLAPAEAWLALLVLVVAGYFHGGASWNQNSRLDAIFAFVEPGTPDTLSFRIDRFLPDPQNNINTGDWSRHGDSYYSNKAPGPIFIAIPVYALLFGSESLLGMPTDGPRVAIVNAYLLNLFASVAMLALGAVALLRLLGRMGRSPRAALELTSMVVFCTALFPYATQMWGHVTAASFVLLSLAAYVGAGRLFAAGFFAGAAGLSDYLALVYAIGLTVLCIVQHRAQAIRLVLGGAIPGTALLIYNAVCFGDPFVLSIQLNNPVFQGSDHLVGALGLPSLEVVGQLLLGLRRGILLQMPILIFAVLGFGFWWRRDRHDGLMWLCLATTVVTILVNAAFNGWHGGATVSARYLIPCLPLFGLALAELPERWLSGRLVTVAAIVSLANMLAIAAVNPMVSDLEPNPLFGFTYGAFFAGNLSPYFFPIRLQALHPDTAHFQHLTMWNWGEVMGLDGLWSLLPLAALIAGFWLVRPRALRAEIAA